MTSESGPPDDGELDETWSHEPEVGSWTKLVLVLVVIVVGVPWAFVTGDYVLGVILLILGVLPVYFLVRWGRWRSRWHRYEHGPTPPS